MSDSEEMRQIIKLVEKQINEVEDQQTLYMYPSFVKDLNMLRESFKRLHKIINEHEIRRNQDGSERTPQPILDKMWEIRHALDYLVRFIR